MDSLTFAIPFYSGIEFLPRALASLRSQRDGSWRAIVCDNASPDPAAVEKLVRGLGDDRVRYVRHSDNLGMAGNFNRCLSLAQTDLVTLLHADDELLPTYTETMLAAAARHPRAVAIYCRAEIIDVDSKPRFSLPDVVKDRFVNPSPNHEIVLSGEGGIRALLAGNFIFAPTLCFRRSVLRGRGFPEGFVFVLDQELTTRLLFDGDDLVGLSDRCYRYRRHDSNATAEFTRSQIRFHEESAFYDRILAKVQERGWGSCVARAREKRIIKLSVAFHALESALRRDGDQLRRYIKLLGSFYGA